MINARIFYYKRLVSENIVYIIAFSLYLFIFAYLGIVYSGQYRDTAKKISLLKKQVSLLEKKQKIIKKYRLSKKDDLDLFDNILMRLIPRKEDFFSIINSLEKLSQETNFQIISYKVNFHQPKKNYFLITISGVGSKDQFISFLKKYNFSGGRLITIDTISFSEAKTSQYKASLTFYNAPAKINSQADLKPISKKDYQFLKTLVGKLSFELVSNEAGGDERGTETINYPVNPNPF